MRKNDKEQSAAAFGDTQSEVVMREWGVLFLIKALQWRTEECPGWARTHLRSEVLWLADFAEQWLDYDKDLRYGLLMVRSLAIARRPLDALARFDSTLQKALTKDRP
jgi:hypothetical protein